MVDIDSILKPFQHFGVHLGLERTEKILAKLGNPHHRVPTIHVAGTNGKGSVCAYLSAVLTEAGYRVGRYTSPHLVDWNERICLNEQAIASETFQELLWQVQAAIAPDEESPTQFEVITAAAWLYFATQQVDIAVIEVGLGGRLDATNVIERPLVAIITSISREHWQQLGSTLAQIANEKAGILKFRCPAVIGDLPPEAQAVVCQRIDQLECPAIFPVTSRRLEQNWAEFTGLSVYPSTFPLHSCQYPLALAGDIQLHNSALAIAALQILQSQGWQISEQAIASGMAKTQWRGRLQWTTWRGRQILVDGAHNPASAQVLRQYVDSLNQPSVDWVMGMLSTKDHTEIFQALLRSGDRLSLVPVPDHNSADPEWLATLAKSICPDLDECQTFASLTIGLDTAISKSENLIILCGSLYLLGTFFLEQQI